MKKLFTIFALATCLSIGFSSCESADDEFSEVVKNADIKNSDLTTEDVRKPHKPGED